MHCSGIFSLGLLRYVLTFSNLKCILLFHNSTKLYTALFWLLSNSIICTGRQIITLIDLNTHLLYIALNSGSVLHHVSATQSLSSGANHCTSLLFGSNSKFYLILSGLFSSFFQFSFPFSAMFHIFDYSSSFSNYIFYEMNTSAQIPSEVHPSRSDDIERSFWLAICTLISIYLRSSTRGWIKLLIRITLCAISMKHTTVPRPSYSATLTETMGTV